MNRVRRFKINLTKRNIAIITAAAVVVCVTGGYFAFRNKSKQAMAEGEMQLDSVMRGDIKAVITGSAAVEPYERYEIISMVSGDVIKSPYDVGDNVNEGDVLYQFDMETARRNIQKQELSLEQSKNNLDNAREDYYESVENLEITAPCDGIISGLTIKKGNEVSANQQLGMVENTKDLVVYLPFTAEQAKSIYVGQSASVSSSAHMSSVTGRVESISSESMAQDNGSKTYNVKIVFRNPGAFTEGLTVGGEIAGMQSPSYGMVEYSEASNFKSEISGKITEICHSNGDFVNKGEVIARISSDALKSQEKNLKNSELSYKNSELSMAETLDSLDNYSITSPISGTVITKNAKAGDTIDRTNSQQALMVVADISKLKFSMEIDELDVSEVSEGQAVDITCDALPKERFLGEIMSISVEGTATNGVTTYTAEVVINEPKNLRPSMNIDASIIIDSKQNVLMVPAGDVKTAMGVSYVFLQDETGTRGATEEDFQKAMTGGNRKTNEIVQGEGETLGIQPVEGKKTTEKGNSQNKRSMLPEAPDGFVIAIVETGITDDDYIEIKSGLNEGDLIQRLTTESSALSGFMGMMAQMHGGGGMNMDGGMPGGRPGGMR